MHTNRAFWLAQPSHLLAVQGSNQEVAINKAPLSEHLCGLRAAGAVLQAQGTCSPKPAKKNAVSSGKKTLGYVGAKPGQLLKAVLGGSCLVFQSPRVVVAQVVLH